MHLGGQGGQRGYAMAAVLVAVAVMGIVMSALLPVWRHQSQREKEAELLFRMQQYALAIDLYRAKNNNQFPPSIDALVQGKYLRKKYKDPMTDDDFQPLFQGQQPGGGRGQGAPQAGGIVGVASKSKETAIRNQRGATTYNQWQVTVADAPPGPGYPVGARGNRGAGPQSGAPGGQPGGRGNVPPGGRGNPGIGGPGRGTPPFGPVGGPGRGGPGRGGGPGGGPIQLPGGRRGGN